MHLAFQYSNPCSWCSSLSEVCISKSPSACKSEMHTIIILFRKYTHYYQHSTKGRLNKSWAAIFRNMHITILILMKHRIMIRNSITIIIDRLPYRYVSQISSLCLCRVCACTCLCMCVCVDTSVYIRTSEFKSPKV